MLPRWDDWNFYICSQLHSMLSSNPSMSVFTLSATFCFYKTNVYKMGSCYCKRKTKRKVGSLQKLSDYYTTEVLILCTEIVNS